ncbi:MAG: hypothetical protein UD286_06510, partial [Bacteroidales bacterium]|nr:hypothetical protein [Bacteroidales bacterium]
SKGVFRVRDKEMHGTQWVILLYWVPSDRFLLRFCDTYSDAELSSHPAKGWFARTADVSTSFHPAKRGFARTKTL